VNSWPEFGWLPPRNVAHHPEMVDFALHLQRITKPQARVAVICAGIVPYFANRYMIDVLGKSDRHVARLPMHDAAFFYPGHLKWDYAYSIQSLHADVVANAWPDWDTVTPFLDGFEEHQRNGNPYYLRSGSPRIEWTRVAESEGEEE
jgi:hypothetical protein